jgi:hypothetical protein
MPSPLGSEKGFSELEERRRRSAEARLTLLTPTVDTAPADASVVYRSNQVVPESHHDSGRPESP